MVAKKAGITVLCLLLLCSCVDFQTLVKTGLQGVPLWVSQPDVRSGKETFVGQGTDSNPFNARLEAMHSILEQISSSVGEDVQERYYREFTTTDAIAELGVTVVREARVEEITYLMAEGDAKALAAQRTDLVNKRNAQDALIASLLSQTDQAYRDNQDVQAIQYGLDALYAAVTEPSSYDADTLLKRSLKYIDAIRFRLSSVDPAHATATVRVDRKRLLFSPKVRNAPIAARFLSENLQEGRFEDRLLFNSGSGGIFQFHPYISSIINAGEISFVIDIQDRLEKLKPVLSADVYQSLVDAVEAHSVSFSYAFVSPYASHPMVVNIQEYSIDGTLLDRHEVQDKMVSYLTTKGITSLIDTSTTNDGVDLAKEIRARYPDSPYLLYGTVGVVEYPMVGQTRLVVASGQMRLYDLATGNVVIDTTEIKATGEDQESAFSQIAAVAASFFSEYL